MTMKQGCRVLVVLLSLAIARAAAATTPIFLSDTDGVTNTLIFQVNQSTGALTQIVSISPANGEVLGLAAASDNLLYAAAQNGNVLAITVSPPGITVLGNIGANLIGGLAMSSGGILYALDEGSDQLSTIQTSPVGKTVIGQVHVGSPSGPVLDISGGDLAQDASGTWYLWTNSSQDLYTLNVATAVATQLDPGTAGLGAKSGLAIDYQGGGLLYGSSGSLNQLLTLNKTNGVTISGLNFCDPTLGCPTGYDARFGDLASPFNCDDGNICTTDSFVLGTGCVHTNNSAPCNDNLFCNGTDTCSGGTCSHTGDPCPGPDGDNDCEESCDEATDACTADDPNDSACSDGLFCDGTETCSSGTCGSSTGNPCLGHNTGPACNDSCDEGTDTCTASDTSGTSCDDGLFCTVTDTCDGGGSCVGTGDPCPGPDGDTNCAESCNEGANDCTAADADGTLCRADAGECDVAETCLSGACPADSFEPVGTACGDPSNTECTNRDTCDGGGSCQANDETEGTGCGDPSDTACTDPDACNGAGTCLVNHAPTSVVCRAATTGGVCDEVEFCDGAGNCPADGFKPSTVECRADAGECDVAENCTGNSPFCPPNGFEASGTACGDPSDTACDNPDSCDGNNTCLDNLEPSTVECRATTGTCDAAETCDGAGNCPADGVKAAGTPCPSDGNVCTLDECDGASTLCQHPAGNAGTTCRAAAGDCDVAETCNGTSITCPADAFKAAGATCGSPTNTDCTDPDTCNGAGVCLANNAANGTACEDGNACTTGETCTNGACAGGSGTCALDHYKCYQGRDLKNPKFTKTTATTSDQIIANETVELQKVKFVCTPVDKNGEGISDLNAHLTCYQIKAANLSQRPTLEVSTQFQSSKFQAKKGKLLCVPGSRTILP